MSTRAACLALGVVALLGATAPPSHAQSTLPIEERVKRLESMLNSGALIELLERVETLQAELQALRGTIEEQTRVVLELIGDTLAEAGCALPDVVKAMVWLRDRADFPGFNQVYGEYFPDDPPARSAVVSELLVDVRVEIEVVAYKPLS